MLPQIWFIFNESITKRFDILFSFKEILECKDFNKIASKISGEEK